VLVICDFDVCLWFFVVPDFCFLFLYFCFFIEYYGLCVLFWFFVVFLILVWFFLQSDMEFGFLFVWLY